MFHSKIKFAEQQRIQSLRLWDFFLSLFLITVLFVFFCQTYSFIIENSKNLISFVCLICSFGEGDILILLSEDYWIIVEKDASKIQINWMEDIDTRTKWEVYQQKNHIFANAKNSIFCKLWWCVLLLHIRRIKRINISAIWTIWCNPTDTLSNYIVNLSISLCQLVRSVNQHRERAVNLK